MAYGTIKIDTITFTDGGIDKSVAISGLVQNPTFTGNVTVTGTISGNTVRGQTVSGVTLTGTTAQFTSGTFTSLTGVTVTGTTANFTSGNFTNISGGTHTITSGVFASGTAANPSISFVSDPNTGIYSPGADQVAISTNGNGRLFVDASGKVGLGTGAPDELLHIKGDVAEFKGTNTNQISDTTGTEQVFKLGIEGQRDGVYGPAGSIIFRQDATTWSSVDPNNKPTRIEFCVQDDSSSDVSETPRLVVNHDGRVGIGTTSPSELLAVSNTAGNAFCQIIASNASFSVLTLGDSDNGYVQQIRSNHTDNSLSFHTASPTSAGNERARIDSSGRLLVGTSTTVAASTGVEGGFQHQGATSSYANANLGKWTNDNGGYALYFGKSRGTSVGSHAIVQDNDVLGYLAFEGSDGTALKRAAAIFAAVDGTPAGPTPGPVSMPGSLVFLTTADGKSSPTERMRISNAGTTTLTSDASTAPFIANISATEVARIDSSGRLLVGASISQVIGATVPGAIQVAHGSGLLGLSLTRYTDDTTADAVILGKTRSTTPGSFSTVISGDGLGLIRFAGDDGTDLRSYGAQIAAISEGTIATGSIPARLAFSITLDGASSPTEALRITNDRVVAYNQAAPAAVNATATLTVANLKTGIITSTSAAATDMTLPTGTNTEAGFSGIYTNMTFEWSVINTGPSLVRVLAGTAHTIVGSGSVATGTSGRFASRRTAANTFVTYRLS